MTGVSKKTVMRLLVEAGAVAAEFQDQLFHNLTCKRLQLDEMWAFIAAKQKNVTPEMAEKNPSAGDVWLWVAIDADSKLVPCWTLGSRDAGTAKVFVSDLASRLNNRVQITSDGHRPYIEAVPSAAPVVGLKPLPVLSRSRGCSGLQQASYRGGQSRAGSW
jgi:IS1 family transposase